MVFPFVVMVILDIKYRQRYCHQYKKNILDTLYDFLYEGLKT